MEERRRPVSLAELAGRPIEPPAQASNNGARLPTASSPSATFHHTENRPGSTAGRGYNIVVFEGCLAETPVLATARTSSRVYCRVAVIQDQPEWNGQPGSQSLDLLMFDERATMFVDRFHKGMRARSSAGWRSGSGTTATASSTWTWSCTSSA
jgi:hypothetical protein